MEQALTLLDNVENTRIAPRGSFSFGFDRDRICAAVHVMQLLFLEVEVRRSRRPAARQSNQQAEVVLARTKT